MVDFLANCINFATKVERYETNSDHFVCSGIVIVVCDHT